MNQWNLTSPLLVDMQVLSCLSQTEGAATYLVQQIHTGDQYIFKDISVPVSQTQVDALRYSGAIQTAGEAQAYYEKVISDYQTQLAVLKKLSKNGTVCAYDQHHIHPKKEAVGFDVHLLMKQRQTLKEYLEQTPMTHRKALELAQDIASSLADLRRAGYIHCDVKPENIYRNEQGRFTLGALGLCHISQLSFATVADRMLGKYAAPELFEDMHTPNETISLYALGLILYAIYNGGHSFYAEEALDDDAPSQMRLKGTPLPAPLYADYEMAEILANACAYAPEDRYPTPESFLEALKDYAGRNDPQDTLIVPPLVADDDIQLTEEALNEEVVPVQFASSEDMDEEFIAHFSPDTQMPEELLECTAQEEPVQAEDAPESADSEQQDAETKAPDSAEDAAASDESAVMPEAEPDTAAEAAGAQSASQKKRFPVWAWILAILLSIAGAAVAAYFFLLPHVSQLDAQADGTSSIVLSVTSNRPLEKFTAVCTDTYGNTLSAQREEDRLVFSDLNPGTQYNILLQTKNGLPIRGMYTATAATAPATEILYFLGKPLSQSQIELTFNIAGQDQDAWTIEYGTGETDKVQTTFPGHSTVISNLKPNNAYTFTLLSTDQLALTGQLRLEHNTTVTTAVTQIYAESTTSDVTLNWSYEGETPAQWSVICSGPNGFVQNDTVTEPTVTYNTLEQDKVYTVDIFCSGMEAAQRKTLRTAGASLTDLKLKANENGTYTVSWVSENTPEDGWQVVCRSGDDTLGSANYVQTQETNAVLNMLLPGCSYMIEVQTGSGLAVEGSEVLELTVPAPRTFRSYGLTRTDLTLHSPGQEDSTAPDAVGAALTQFHAGDSIVPILEARSTLKTSSNTVTVTAVVRSGDVMLSYASNTAKWRDLWQNKLMAGLLISAPKTAGTYTVDILINRAIAGSAQFTVSE